MKISDMNWMQVEDYLKKDDRLIIVVGAIEQHGYLSLATDVKIPMKLAEEASEKTGVLIAPPMNFGCSPYFTSYPGTLSVRVSTLLAVIEDIIRSAYNQGFRKILVLNGHGGNTAISTYLYELANELLDMQAKFYSWWTQEVIADIAKKHGLEGNHANWMEAFPFTVIGEMPKEKKETPGPIHTTNSDEVRKHYGDGSFGGDYLAEEKVMDEVFEACLDEVLGLLKFD
jgi:creatinine amidohydrolase